MRSVRRVYRLWCARCCIIKKKREERYAAKQREDVFDVR